MVSDASSTSSRFFDSLHQRYVSAATSVEESHKVMCSSDSWLNRLAFVLSLLPLEETSSWIDLGTGTGKLLELGALNPRSRQGMRLVGLDGVGTLLSEARSKKMPEGTTVEWVEAELSSARSCVVGPFDLVTMIGVVYQCGLDPLHALRVGVDLLGPGGTMVATIENPEWVKWKPDPDEISISVESAHRALNEWRQSDVIEEFEVILANTQPLETEKFTKSSCIEGWKEFAIRLRK